MDIIDPLGGAAKAQPATATAGLVDPFRLNPRLLPTKATYELGNSLCPDCGQPMEQLEANDVLSNVCIAHRICLPVKDAE